MLLTVSLTILCLIFVCIEQMIRNGKAGQSPLDFLKTLLYLPLMVLPGSTWRLSAHSKVVHCKVGSTPESDG